MATELEAPAPALARLLPDLPLLLPQLAAITVLPALDPEQEKHRLFAVLLHFFTSQAERHPTLLVIEDIHWCDETSLEFLLHLAADIAHQQWMAGAYYVFTRTYVLLLAPHLALPQAEAGLTLARSSGSSYWINSIVTYYAFAHLQRKELASAEALLSTVMLPEHTPRSLGERRVTWAWGELFLQQGKPMQALERAESLLALAPGGDEFRSQPIPALLKLKGEALLALSRLDEALMALEDAKSGASMRQEPSLLWQVHRSLGQGYRLHGREEQAQQEWAAARRIIEQLTSTIDDETLREYFSQAALASLPREKPSSSRRAIAQQFGGLTERERQVVVLIAQACRTGRSPTRW